MRYLRYPGCDNNAVLYALVAASMAALLASSCGQKKKADDPDSASTEQTDYELQCITGPPPPPQPGTYIDPNNPHPDLYPLPAALPRKTSPIKVQSCDALNQKPPLFGQHKMPGLVAVVDCKANLVRFKTRDYQVAESAAPDPSGQFDLRVMYILRLVSDAAGYENCWVRVLGHVKGAVACPRDPGQARLDFQIDWTFDETPPDAMEPPPPELADFRNGRHCILKPGNCSFQSSLKMGCDGS